MGKVSQHNCRLSIVVGTPSNKRWGPAKWKREFRSRLAELDLYAIYIIGPKAGRPSKIGYAKRVEPRRSSVAMAHWEHEIELHFFCWCSGAIRTKMLEKMVHARLKNTHLRGEWFDVTAEEAALVILAAARSTNTKVYMQEKIDACMRTNAEREIIEALK